LSRRHFYRQEKNIIRHGKKFKNHDIGEQKHHTKPYLENTYSAFHFEENKTTLNRVSDYNGPTYLPTLVRSQCNCKRKTWKNNSQI